VTFSNEEEFRRWIVAKLPTHLGQEWTVLLGKNLSDIVLCWNRDTMPLILFVEVKYHRANHGRIGIGSGKGKGYQAEFLLKKPLYLERNLRWVVADQESEKCLFFDNDDVRENSAGQIQDGKQNNFTKNVFEKKDSLCFSLEEAPRRIAEWARSRVNGAALKE
jgi:hypothetical protein